MPLDMSVAFFVIPNYIYFASIGLLNKPITLPILYLGYNLPMAIWILKGAMEGIPHELDESATIDGASRFRTFWSIILPLCRPRDRKSTRLNSSHVASSYAVFCL